jgi:hypothetical protein
MQDSFDSIRYYHDTEVNAAFGSILQDPMMLAILEFSFPKISSIAIRDLANQIHSIHDFQSKIAYPALQRVLASAATSITHDGFDQLDSGTPYLFISNHRDIVLDTALLNYILLEAEKIMTASAIGDNLVKTPFLLALARINRNFIVRRNLPPRELLESSKLLSQYIQYLLQEERRSVWIAQREGRAKNGNDFTHPGVLKMIGMACSDGDLPGFFKRMRIVPVSISYEFDPTDVLKVPELLSLEEGKPYVKAPEEDFYHILTGITGQKGRIHFQAGAVLDEALETLKELQGANAQIKGLAEIIDREVISGYRLWPANYIAFDLLSGEGNNDGMYTLTEKEEFVEGIFSRLKSADPKVIQCFLSMYANPVANRKAIQQDRQIKIHLT